MLWNAVQNSPFFTTSNFSWSQFQHIVGQFHSNSPVDDYQQLHTLNRETVSYIVATMKQMNARVDTSDVHNSHTERRPSDQTTPGVSRPRSLVVDDLRSSDQMMPIYTRTEMVNQREQEFHSNLSMRQAELSATLNNKLPPEIDFRMKSFQEEPITNMAELLEQHKRDREQMIPPPQTPKSVLTQVLDPPHLYIHHDVDVPIPVVGFTEMLGVAQTHPVEGRAGQRPSDQTSPVAKPPAKLVVEGLWSSDQNSSKSLPVKINADHEFDPAVKHVHWDENEANKKDQITEMLGQVMTKLNELDWKIGELLLLKQKEPVIPV